MGRGKIRRGCGKMAAAGQGMDPLRVGFVGAGRMAEAIAQGFIRAGGARGSPGLGARGVRRPRGVRGEGSPAGSAPARRDACRRAPGRGAGATREPSARGRQGAAGRAGRAWARADRGRCPCGLLAQHSGEGCAWEELVVPRGAVSHVGPHST